MISIFYDHHPRLITVVDGDRLKFNSSGHWVSVSNNRVDSGCGDCRRPLVGDKI